MFDLLSAAKVKDNMQGGWAGGGMKEEMIKEEEGKIWQVLWRFC